MVFCALGVSVHSLPLTSCVHTVERPHFCMQVFPVKEGLVPRPGGQPAAAPLNSTLLLTLASAGVSGERCWPKGPVHRPGGQPAAAHPQVTAALPGG